MLDEICVPKVNSFNPFLTIVGAIFTNYHKPKSVIRDFFVQIVRL